MPSMDLIVPTNFLLPDTISLGKLFSKGPYSIPDYQRDYRWKEENIQQLWDDISATSDRAFDGAGTIISDPRPHFLGPIVLEKFKSNEGKTPEIMDGQQRLVSLSALFSVLHEFATKLLDSEERDAWKNTIEATLFTYTFGKKVPKLSLAKDDQIYQELVCNRFTKSDRDTYLSSLQIRNDSVAYHLNLNMDLLHNCIDEYLGPPGTKDFDRKFLQLITTVEQLVIVLEMEVREKGAAYEVFETLNARGLDLQQADLLKNRLYSLAENQNTKTEVITFWDKLVRAIEQQDFISLTEFFHFYMKIKNNETRLSELYLTVRKYLDTPGHSARDFARDASEAAERLQQILEAGGSFSEEFTRHIQSIIDPLNNKYGLMLLIAGVIRYTPTSNEMTEIVKYTHSYVFRRFVVERIGMSKYSSEVSKIAGDFASGAIGDIAELRAALVSKSTDDEFVKQLRNYNAPSNKMGFYIVEMIENHLTYKAGVTVQRQSVSQHLEHIMPKRPNSTEWHHVFGDPEYENYVNRIGNLLVLEANINRHIKNKSLSYKKQNPNNKDYDNSKMRMPATLSTFLDGGNWNFSSINRRQEKIVDDYAILAWPL
jgi:hypothetical protein